jgi:hypothetical protein
VGAELAVKSGASHAQEYAQLFVSQSLLSVLVLLSTLTFQLAHPSEQLVLTLNAMGRLLYLDSELHNPHTYHYLGLS